MRPIKALGNTLCLLAIAGMGISLSSCAETRDTAVIGEASVEVSTAPSRVAITIDDLPYVPRSQTRPAEGQRYVNKITSALGEHNIVATGFAVGQQIDAQSIPALQAFADAGHTVGNHSWSHPDYGTLTSDEFREETVRTDQILGRWIDGARFYRFPYLKEGETEQTKAAAKQILNELGYQNAPVTIDNDEWLFNADYLDAVKKGNAARAANIARRYIAHMQERTLHFQNLAQDELGGDVDHILLIHHCQRSVGTPSVFAAGPLFGPTRYFPNRACLGPEERLATCAHRASFASFH